MCQFKIFPKSFYYRFGMKSQNIFIGKCDKNEYDHDHDAQTSNFLGSSTQKAPLDATRVYLVVSQIRNPSFVTTTLHYFAIW